MNIVDVRANNAYHQIFSCIYKSLFVICTTGGPLEMRILVLGGKVACGNWKIAQKKLEGSSHINRTCRIRISRKFAYL